MKYNLKQSDEITNKKNANLEKVESEPLGPKLEKLKKFLLLKQIYF